MKFIRFLKKDVKIINSYFLIILVLLILVGVGYTSYALFSISKTSNNIIELEVGEMTKLATETLILQTNNLNDSGLYTITHNADSTLQIGATEVITEYRYRGASPKNYVSFNNETWRIIGVFPTEDGNGNIENRIKLIRNESIGQYVADSNNSVEIAWPETNMNNNLNGTYLSSLTSETQNMIGNAKYYLGGYDGYNSQNGLIQTPVDMYSYERKINGSDYYYGTNPNSFIGKIGVMYASDYGYASDACETKQLYNNNSSSKDIRACNDTNWLYNIKNAEWLLDQNPDRGLGVDFYYTNKNGYIDNSGGIFSTHNFHVRPVLYLTSAVQITGGDGTESNPYIFSL